MFRLSLLMSLLTLLNVNKIHGECESNATPSAAAITIKPGSFASHHRSTDQFPITKQLFLLVSHSVFNNKVSKCLAVLNHNAGEFSFCQDKKFIQVHLGSFVQTPGLLPQSNYPHFISFDDDYHLSAVHRLCIPLCLKLTLSVHVNAPLQYCSSKSHFTILSFPSVKIQLTLNDFLRVTEEWQLRTWQSV